MLQRIYGTAFPSASKSSNDYLTFLEEAAKRDHRTARARAWPYSVEEESRAAG